MKSNSISIISNRRRISLSPEDILYVQLVNRQSVIHVSGGRTYDLYHHRRSGADARQRLSPR